MSKNRQPGTTKKEKERKGRRLNKRLLALETIVQDFMSYFDPRGGISQVPLGPFERAKELLEQ